MNAQQALQTLIAIINQAEFKGSIANIQAIGQQAQEAVKILEQTIKPVENNV